MFLRAATHRVPLLVLVLATGAAAVLGACGPTASQPSATSASAVTEGPAAPAALPAAVSVAEAAALRDAGAFVLDVRQPEEWTEVHIPGATLIPLGELPGRLAEVPRDRQVVVVCHSGNRSKEGRDILLRAGFRQVTSMTGGVSAWKSAGLPTESGA